jgi:hypothetical protein
MLRGHWLLEPDEKTRVRIAALSREIDPIHAANELYWRRGEGVSIEERAEYPKD